MATTSKRNVASAPLVQAAATSGLPFETSPTGRWIRIAGNGGVFYVVQDVWGEGCLLMKIGEEDRREVRHFLNVHLAVMAAARESGVSRGSWQDDGGTAFAEAS